MESSDRCTDPKFNNMKNDFYNTRIKKGCKKQNHLCDQELLDKDNIMINMPNSAETVKLNMNFSKDEAPSVTCENDDERSKFMLIKNRVHKSCCPSQYSLAEDVFACIRNN